MLPSPSCGSPPKWRGASWKFSTSTLTTTAWLRLDRAVAGGDDLDRRLARVGFGGRRRGARSPPRRPPRTSARPTPRRRRARRAIAVLRAASGAEHYVLLAARDELPAEPSRTGSAPPPAARRSWLQLVKFGLVGGSGYLINLAVFAVLTGNLGLHHAVAAIGAFCVAVTNNFLWNRHWTFGAGDGLAGFQAVRFFAVSVASPGDQPGRARGAASPPARSATSARRRSRSPSRCRSTSSATSSGPSPEAPASRRGRRSATPLED